MNEKHRLSALLANCKLKLSKIVMQTRSQNADIATLVKPLTPEEAIGKSGRRNFSIIEGKERVIEAQVLGAKGHAFIDSPGDFFRQAGANLKSASQKNTNQALYIATLNATLRYLNLCEKTVHCKDEEPERCAKEIAAHILKGWGKVRIGIVGLNPAIAEALVQTFGQANVKITDLNLQNINTSKYGLKICDGRKMTDDLIKQSDVILITGTTFVNGTSDFIMEWVRNYQRDYLIYGVTAAGVCKLMRLNRIGPYGKNQ